MTQTFTEYSHASDGSEQLDDKKTARSDVSHKKQPIKNSTMPRCQPEITSPWGWRVGPWAHSTRRLPDDRRQRRIRVHVGRREE